MRGTPTDRQEEIFSPNTRVVDRQFDAPGPPRHAWSMDDAFCSSRPVAGILLTGGTSRRMGFDKAAMLIGGVPCAARVAAAMQAVIADAVEVGPGVSGLPAVQEEPPGGGPLVAVCAGAKALNETGGARSALVLACDLPLVTETLLRTLVQWPGSRSVVPIIERRPQPLCARWSAEDLAAAADMVEAGMRSMHSLLDRPGVMLVDENRWPGDVDRAAFADVDTPSDLEGIGLAWEIPGPSAGTAGRWRCDG
jgi:molybdopterin-guanine dinucleotide biosynthesis protein A